MPVEREALEVVGVELNGIAADLNGLCFDLSHELPPEAVSTELVTQPKVRDEQPVPMLLANDTADNRAVGAPNECCEPSPVLRPNVLDVVAHQASDDLLHILRRRVVD
jgi:hypothetical protein